MESENTWSRVKAHGVSKLDALHKLTLRAMYEEGRKPRMGKRMRKWKRRINKAGRYPKNAPMFILLVALSSATSKNARPNGR